MDRIKTVRKEYSNQISELESECSGHDLRKKDPQAFYLVESYKAFISALDWIKED